MRIIICTLLMIVISHTSYAVFGFDDILIKVTEGFSKMEKMIGTMNTISGTLKKMNLLDRQTFEDLSDFSDDFDQIHSGLDHLNDPSGYILDQIPNDVWLLNEQLKDLNDAQKTYSNIDYYGDVSGWIDRKITELERLFEDQKNGLKTSQPLIKKMEDIDATTQDIDSASPKGVARHNARVTSEIYKLHLQSLEVQHKILTHHVVQDQHNIANDLREDIAKKQLAALFTAPDEPVLAQHFRMFFR